MRGIIIISKGSCHICNFSSNKWILIPQQLIGNDWKYSTVGIVGLGGVGQTIVKSLYGFGVGKFLYCGRTEKPEGAKIGAKFVSLDQL